MIQDTIKYARGRTVYLMNTIGGYSIKSIAIAKGWNWNSARRYKHIYTRNTEPNMIEYDEEVYTGKAQKLTLPLYTGHETIEGDCIVTGDWHIPTTYWKMIDWVITVAKQTKIKRLAIVGDLLNFDALSYYPPVTPEIDIFDEFRASRAIISELGQWFDEILLSLGNHELRFLKSRRGRTTLDELMTYLASDKDRGKFQITAYPYMTIVSGSVKWHATHPRNYSRIKGRLGDTLAQKHQSNVIVFHQHHVGKIVDSFGRYVIIDGGGLFDVKKMAYVQMQDSNMPVMCNGFVVLKDGVGELITPYPAFTDLARWGFKE